jgi:hypothetical protein
MPKFLALVFVSCLAALPLGAQIQDNSFLLEEAYNQETGVVQHINTFTLFDDSDDWAYTFTQEWPAPGQRHQLSATLPYLRVTGDGDQRGLGDVAVNYRYQLLGSGEAAVAFSPRFSLVLPTGDEAQGRGTGALGYQVNLPLSAVLSPRAVTHVNVGATFTPGAENPDGSAVDLEVYSFGQSFIWLLRERLNLMLELAFASGDDESFFVNPGLRWAHDLPSRLQIVPGIAFPIGVGPSQGERTVFLYLSFEHPFR